MFSFIVFWSNPNSLQTQLQRVICGNCSTGQHALSLLQQRLSRKISALSSFPPIYHPLRYFVFIYPKFVYCIFLLSRFVVLCTYYIPFAVFSFCFLFTVVQSFCCSRFVSWFCVQCSTVFSFLLGFNLAQVFKQIGRFHACPHYDHDSSFPHLFRFNICISQSTHFRALVVTDLHPFITPWANLQKYYI